MVLRNFASSSVSNIYSNSFSKACAITKFEDDITKKMLQACVKMVLEFKLFLINSRSGKKSIPESSPRKGSLGTAKSNALA